MTIATDTKPKLPLDWGVIIFMTVVHIGAVCAFLPGNLSWQGFALAIALHWLTGGIGITLGWHRLITHRSFQVPQWLEYIIVFCGTLAMQGGVIWWVGLHRHHHLHSDESIDHHDSSKGFWWSHMGWMMYDVPAEADVPRFTKDISEDKFYQFLDKYFLPVQILFALFLYAIGGWSFVCWGTFFRLAIVYQTTWLVNSATHMFGYRTFSTKDNSRNCWWVALLTYGEGWHNNHHAHQYSARHGLAWWELDQTWLTIRLLQLLGLATKVKLPDGNAIEA
jgi:sn-1 stearoyl-lipid 9-desaturase